MSATCKKHRGIRKSENPKAQQPWGGLHLLMQMAIHRPTNPGICKKLWKTEHPERSAQPCQQPAKNLGKSENPKDPGNYASNLQKTSVNPKIRKSESSATRGGLHQLMEIRKIRAIMPVTCNKPREIRKVRKIRATMAATCKKHREIRKSENPKAQQPWGGLHQVMEIAGDPHGC